MDSKSTFDLVSKHWGLEPTNEKREAAKEKNSRLAYLELVRSPSFNVFLEELIQAREEYIQTMCHIQEGTPSGLSTDQKEQIYALSFRIGSLQKILYEIKETIQPVEKE